MPPAAPSPLPFAELPDAWPLDDGQLRWLSCETLMLCMPVDLSQLSERELRALNHTLASQLGAQTPEGLASTLRLEGYDDMAVRDMQHLQPFLHFRLLLLIYKRPGAFPSPSAFGSWVERQISIVYNGLVGVLRSCAARGVAIDDAAEGNDPPRVVRLIEQLGSLCEQLRDHTRAYAEALGNDNADARTRTPSPLAFDLALESAPDSDEAGGSLGIASASTAEDRLPGGRVRRWTAEYTSLVRQLHAVVWESYASLDSAAAEAALEHKLPLPYPLNVRLYATLLLSTFGRDGMPLASTDAVVQLLMRVRRPFALSVQVHLACLAEATFVMHRRHPKAVDLAAAMLRRVQQLPPPPPRSAPLPGTLPLTTSGFDELVATGTILSGEDGKEGGGAGCSDGGASGGGSGKRAALSLEQAAFHQTTRGMREHFRLQLSNMHGSFRSAPKAIVQHVLDAYVHLYSLHTSLQGDGFGLPAVASAVPPAGVVPLSLSNLPLSGVANDESRDVPARPLSIMGSSSHSRSEPSVPRDQSRDGSLHELVQEELHGPPTVVYAASQGGNSASTNATERASIRRVSAGSADKALHKMHLYDGKQQLFDNMPRPTALPPRPSSALGAPAAAPTASRQAEPSVQLPPSMTSTGVLTGNTGPADSTGGGSIGVPSVTSLRSIISQPTDPAYTTPGPTPATSRGATPPSTPVMAPKLSPPRHSASSSVPASASCNSGLAGLASNGSGLALSTDAQTAAASHSGEEGGSDSQGSRGGAKPSADGGDVTPSGELPALSAGGSLSSPWEGMVSCEASDGRKGNDGEQAGAHGENETPMDHQAEDDKGEGNSTEGKGNDDADSAASAVGSPATWRGWWSSSSWFSRADTAPDSAASPSAAASPAAAPAASPSTASPARRSWFSRGPAPIVDVKAEAPAGAPGGLPDKAGASTARSSPSSLSSQGRNSADMAAEKLPPSVLGGEERTDRDSIRSQVLGGPPEPVLEEINRLYRVSVRRSWAEIRGQVRGPVAGGSSGSLQLPRSGTPTFLEPDGGGKEEASAAGSATALAAVAAAAGASDAAAATGMPEAAGGATSGSASPAPAVGGELDVEQMVVLGGVLSERLERERHVFIPCFAQYSPAVAEMASEEWTKLFLEQLHPTLRAHVAAAKSPKAQLEALTAFLPLWRVVHRLSQRFGLLPGGAAVTVWRQHLMPLTEAWLEQQGRAFGEEIARLKKGGVEPRPKPADKPDKPDKPEVKPEAKLEGKPEAKPEPPKRSPRWLISTGTRVPALDALWEQLSASVHELLRMKMPPPLFGETALRLGALIDSTLLAFTASALEELATFPQLQALRAHVRNEMRLEAGQRGGSRGGWNLARFVGGKGSVGAVEERLEAEALPSLCLRLCSLHEALETLERLEPLLKTAEQHERLEAQGGGALCGAARAALLEGTRRVCELIGVKVVYVELRERFLHGLYTPRAADADMRSVLKPLNVALGTVLRCVPRPAVRQQLVTEIFLVWVHGVHSVLLDGGPARHFMPEDEQIFGRDLKLLQEFFLAKDAQGVPQGVPKGVVDEATRPLCQLLVLLGTPSETLSELWESGRDADTLKALPRTPSEDNVAQVLLHRSDDVAKAWKAKHARHVQAHLQQLS